MSVTWFIAIMASVVALVNSLLPLAAYATTFPMKHTSIELNSNALSSPLAFTYHNTTFMPLFYVQQLLNKLQLQNTWDGAIWNITTPFSGQPAFVLQTNNGLMGIVINQKSFAAHVDKVVTTDPSSQKNTTFIPIWYIMQTLKSLGLQSTWNGTNWTVTTEYTDVSKTDRTLGSFSNLTDAKAALLDYPGGMVKDSQGNLIFTEPSFTNVDLRFPAPSNINVSSLNQYLTDHNSIMAGLGQAFMDAQSRYGVDANYLVSHAIEETGSDGNVSDIALMKNNLYGYGAFDANATEDAGTFPSEAYAILFQAWEVCNNYLNEGSSHYVTPTLSGMSGNYASDPDWANKVNDLMDQLAIKVNDNVTSYTQYFSQNQPVIPAGSNDIPVYDVNGVVGVVHTDPYYGNDVPVYVDGGTGHQHMFARELQLGDKGDDVQTLQQALNLAENAGLTADGIFGVKTEAAISDYQTTHGLAATGVCDFNLWHNTLNLSDETSTVKATQTISIDAIVEGMVGGSVSEWYHIPSMGWISAEDVTLTNVYRLTVPNSNSATGVTVQVSDVSGHQMDTLHAGDYVVSQNLAPVGGRIQIQFVNQGSGLDITGYVDSSKTTLTAVNH